MFGRSCCFSLKSVGRIYIAVVGMLNIENFRASGVDNKHIYAIGLSDKLVTIHSQQLRALCLAKLLNDEIQDPEKKNNICIIGGGIAGLTLSLELVKYGWRDINILERLPDFLGIQNGCDTRWVHPGIINWPEQGSDQGYSDSGDLSWDASTASDVTFGIEKKWMEFIQKETTKSEKMKGRPERIISTHVGITYIHGRINQSDCTIEWIRDSRVRPLGFRGSKTNNSEINDYSYVVFATGFGVEASSRNSYWRNDDLGQMHIDGIQRGYLVSGLGDGAISDILRLTTRNFRPDRAIKQIPQLDDLKDLLLEIKQESEKSDVDLIDLLLAERNKISKGIREKWNQLLKHFLQMKREDTKVFVHHNSTEGFCSAFNKSPASFLNKLFLFILHQNGMFQYLDASSLIGGGLVNHDDSMSEILKIAECYGIKNNHIIIRHGVDRLNIVKSILSGKEDLVFREQSYQFCLEYYRENIKNGNIISCCS